MSMDLWLRKNDSLVDKEAFKNALSDIEKESEGVVFEDLSDNSYNARFWGKDMCSVGFKETVNPSEESGEYGQIHIETNSRLSPYAEFIASSLTKKLATTIFDPQNNREVDTTTFNVTLADLKKKHDETFQSDSTREVFTSDAKPFEYNFLIDTVFGYILGPLQKEGFLIGCHAVGDTSNESDRLTFRIIKVLEGNNSLAAEIMINSIKEANSASLPKRQVKLSVVDPTVLEKIKSLVDSFTRRALSLESRLSQKEDRFIFTHSTEPAPQSPNL